MHQNQYPALTGNPQSLESALWLRVFQALPLEGFGVGEHRRRFLERDAAFSRFLVGCSGIPDEHHLCMYDNYSRTSKDMTELWPQESSPLLEIAFRRFVDFDAYGKYKNF